jgi:formylglycine-generating enzyme required for sulfatase activity
MLPRSGWVRQGLGALGLGALALAGCQKIWGFEDFDTAGGAAGGGAGGQGGSGGGVAGSGGGVAGSGGASGGSAGAACEDKNAPVGMVSVRIQDGSCLWIDPKEATRAEYESFRTAAPAKPSNCDWNKSYDAPEKKQGSPCLGPGEVDDAGADAATLPGNLPVTCVDWCDAYGFCAAAAKTLCPGTLAKQGAWYDVCSSNGQNSYPYLGNHSPDFCNDSSSSAKALVEVGSKPSCKTASGVYDMVGNASEWTAACSTTGQAGTCDSRGGNYNDNASLAACNGAVAVAKDVGLAGLGFRCCWAAK